MRILAVSRAEQFSPNSVERDRAIFQAVTDRLQRQGHEIRLVSEDRLDTQEPVSHPDMIHLVAVRFGDAVFPQRL